MRRGLAEIAELSKGGDEGGDPAPERARELNVEIVSADNDVAASIQAPPNSSFALGVDNSCRLSLYFRACSVVFREKPLTLQLKCAGGFSFTLTKHHHRTSMENTYILQTLIEHRWWHVATVCKSTPPSEYTPLPPPPPP